MRHTESRLDRFLCSVRSVLTDDEKRHRFQYSWVYRLLCIISTVMSVVNVITGKWLLMGSTLIFAALCLINVFLGKSGDRGVFISSRLLMAELIALFTFFIVSGEPEGFAAIWTCLLPACGMVLYGIKKGSIMSGVMFLIMIFLLWTGIGNGLLRYEYTASFHLRFPFLYLASYMIATFLEVVRELTQDELMRSRAEYEHLYNHDQLTGLNNRYGFMREIMQPFRTPMTALMLDIDFFKRVNDTYGHAAGDEVLRRTADILRSQLGDKWIISRWGGEEFVAVTGEEVDLAATGEGLCEAFRRFRFKAPNGKEFHATVSIGIVRSGEASGENAEDLLSRADACLYRAKESGRDCFRLEKNQNN